MSKWQTLNGSSYLRYTHTNINLKKKKYIWNNYYSLECFLCRAKQLTIYYNTEKYNEQVQFTERILNKTNQSSVYCILYITAEITNREM